MNEEALTGGNSTVVTRVGDTVRRSAGRWTPAVAHLLTTLRSAGIREVPEHLGLDNRGRETLAFLAGDVPSYPLPPWLWEPAILGEAAVLLRRMHDASAPLVAERLTWQLPTHQPAEVICHNDFAPYNMVFRGARLVGVIDFDTASPGPRIWDLAYLAYRLVPLAEDSGAESPGAVARLQRLDALIAAYGGACTSRQVLLVAAERLADLAAFTDQRAADTGRAEFKQHAAMYRRDKRRLEELSTTLPARSGVAATAEWGGADA